MRSTWCSPPSYSDGGRVGRFGRQGQVEVDDVVGPAHDARVVGRHHDGAAGGRGGINVSLGFKMDYSDEGPGVLLEGTTPGSPAEKAGLKEGDRVTELAGKPIQNVGAYTALLGSLRAGQEVELKVVRKDKKEETLKITPVASGPR